MAYRDRPIDPRIVELEALIEQEPALRAKIAPLRLELDDLRGILAVTEAKLAPRSGLRAWFGKSLDEAERAKWRLAHATHAARIEELATEERRLWAAITAAVEARAELIAIDERAIDALREAEGPLGDEVRQLDVADVKDGAQRAAIDKVLDVIAIARTSMVRLSTRASDLAATERSAGQIMLGLLDPIDDAPDSRGHALEQLAQAFESTTARLLEVLYLYDDTGCAWFSPLPRERLRELATMRRARIEETELVRDAEVVIACMFELSRGLAVVTDRLARNTAERAARRVELVRFGR